MDTKQYQKEYRFKNKLRISQRQSEWYKINRDRLLAKNAEYAKRHRIEINEKRKLYPSRSKKYGICKIYKKVYKPLSPLEKYKEKTRKRTRLAVSHGLLKKLPCTECGNIKSQAHHEDYEKPYEVIWLCQIHHAELHKKKKLSNKNDTQTKDKYLAHKYRARSQRLDDGHGKRPC